MDLKKIFEFILFSNCELTYYIENEIYTFILTCKKYEHQFGINIKVTKEEMYLNESWIEDKIGQLCIDMLDLMAGVEDGYL